MPAQPPDEVMGAFAREQAGLANMAPPEGVIAVGSTQPDVDLLDVQGGAIGLYQVLDGWVSVVVFYRGRGARTAISRCAPTRRDWPRSWPVAAWA
jgi:hypothetical protein